MGGCGRVQTSAHKWQFAAFLGLLGVREPPRRVGKAADSSPPPTAGKSGALYLQDDVGSEMRHLRQTVGALAENAVWEQGRLRGFLLAVKPEQLPELESPSSHRKDGTGERVSDLRR